jgi:hypothetical protein
MASFGFPALISPIPQQRRILPIHAAKVQPPRMRDFPQPGEPVLRGSAAMTNFTLGAA